jgi:8-oxo-dGTP pyrophosphatase MutT (NUDIX family)
MPGTLRRLYIDHMGMSPYLRRIRDRIGTDLLLLPAVSVLIWDQEDRLLLVRGSDSGTWQMVGGAVEPGESPWDAARRETTEETGVEVVLSGIRGVIGGPRFQHTYPNGDQVAFVSTVFDGRIASGTPAADDDETTEVAWFDPAELVAGARDAPRSPLDESLPELALAILDAVGVPAAAPGTLPRRELAAQRRTEHPGV